VADGPSRDAVSFAARRLGAEGIALLLATRADHPAFTGLERIELSGLEGDAARTLIATASTPVAPAVSETLLAASGGNPLALLELPGMLNEAQRAGHEPLEDPLPLGPSLERAFRQRLDDLPENVRWALLVAAAGDSDSMAPIVDGLGGDAGALEAAEAAGLVTLADGALQFRHPLVRAAVYQAATPAERRRAHRALAEALAGDDGRRVWHLAAAATGPDEDVAALLERTADLAAERSGYAASATALARAARLTPLQSERVRRLFLAGQRADLAGRTDEALSLLDQALDSDDALFRARVQHLRGRILSFRAPREAIETILVPEAERVEQLDPSLAVHMLTDAALALPDDTGALPLLERARAVAENSREPLAPEVRLILETLLETQRFDSPADWHWDRLLELANDLSYSESLIAVAADASFEGEFAAAGELFGRVIGTARRSSALGVLASGLTMLVWHDYDTNRWTHAVAHGTAALQLIDETGRVRHLAPLLFMLGRLDAVSGREADCREHVRRAVAVSKQLELDDLAEWQGAVALGLLELGLGHPAEAVLRLEEGVCDKDGLLVPGVGARARGPDRGVCAGERAGARPGRARRVGAARPLVRARMGSRGVRPLRRSPHGGRSDRRALRGGPTPARRSSGAVRHCTHAARIRRTVEARASPHRRARALAGGAGSLRPARSAALGRACARRARGDGGARAQARSVRRRGAHGPGAPGRAGRRRRRDEPRGGGAALRQPQDDRGSPGLHLPQAGHPLADGARRPLRERGPRDGRGVVGQSEYEATLAPPVGLVRSSYRLPPAPIRNGAKGFTSPTVVRASSAKRTRVPPVGARRRTSRS